MTGDIITVIARIGLGSICIAHGWQKFNEWTVAGTSESFSQMGVPLPGIAAPISTFVEHTGGALLLAAMGPGLGSASTVFSSPARRPSRDGVPPRPGRSPRCDSSWHPPRDRLSALLACREPGKKYRHRENERPCDSARTLLAADCDLEGRFRLASRQSGLLLGTDSDIRGVGSVLLPYIHRVAGRRSDGGEADEMLTYVTAAVGAETAKSGQDKQERGRRDRAVDDTSGHFL
ncbi:DoxX family protein [Brevibacterium aurantiacum]|uniref:DoxX family protein n=1 Tax=Brevibacterium aurantiacum TaxID=273384 RepID=UPI0018671B1A|nr:DoxX family protein [Brevibacterium aurantiacum]